ncbi:MAG: hypothetical protein R6X34_29200 [Chloroflexota bacterium]
MTPQELNAAVRRYLDIVRDPATNQETFQAALAEVRAAHAAYEAAPTAVYPSGAFMVQCGQMVVVDAFGAADYAVSLPSVLSGRWRAWVGVVAGVHVALFAWHDAAAPDPSSTLHDLMQQTAWLEVGSVPIDTATCAIADREAYLPLDVDEAGHQIAGVGAHLCFSNTANADGAYPVFAQVKDGKVTGVYVEFLLLAATIE